MGSTFDKECFFVCFLISLQFAKRSQMITEPVVEAITEIAQRTFSQSFQIQHQENCLWKRIQDEDNFDFHVLWPISFKIIQFSRRNVKKFLKKMIFFFNKCLPKLPAILIAECWGSRRHIRLGTINCLKFSSATGDTKFSFVFFSEITSLPCLHSLFPNVLHSPVNAH